MTTSFKPGDRVWVWLGAEESWCPGFVMSAWDYTQPFPSTHSEETYDVQLGVWHGIIRRARAQLLSDDEYAAHLLLT